MVWPRIEGPRISGSATLLNALYRRVPNISLIHQCSQIARSRDGECYQVREQEASRYCDLVPHAPRHQCDDLLVLYPCGMLYSSLVLP